MKFSDDFSYTSQWDIVVRESTVCQDQDLSLKPACTQSLASLLYVLYFTMNLHKHHQERNSEDEVIYLLTWDIGNKSAKTYGMRSQFSWFVSAQIKKKFKIRLPFS